jgi:acetyltransferase-like isoleucine patch superfamily enzyme
MGYLSSWQIKRLGLKLAGNNLIISDKAAIYDAHKITLQDNCRVDDFCILSGELEIGAYTHLAPYVMLAGGRAGIEIGKYVTFAYGAKVFSETDDYSGMSLVGSLVPRDLKFGLTIKRVTVGDYCIIGTNTTIMPKGALEEGVAVGAHSLVKSSLAAWGIYCGVPAKWLRSRKRNVKDQFLKLHPDT